MTAAVAERFADEYNPGFAEAMPQIASQVSATDLRRATIDVVFGIHLPPRVKDGPARRVS